MIYHTVRRDGSIKSVREKGLLSFRELYREGLTKTNPDSVRGTLPDQYSIIYFSPGSETPNNTKKTVGFYVDPKKTYVYNREYRYDVNQKKYLGSKVLLAQYLNNLNSAQTLEKQCKQGQTVIFDPRTSNPFIVNTTDKRFYNPKELCRPLNSYRHYLYLAEVIVQGPKIPPEKLYFLDNEKLD